MMPATMPATVVRLGQVQQVQRRFKHQPSGVIGRHRASSGVIGRHRPPSAPIGLHQSLSASVGCYRSPSVFIGVCRYPSVPIGPHWLSSVATGVPLAAISSHRFLSVAIGSSSWMPLSCTLLTNIYCTTLPLLIGVASPAFFLSFSLSLSLCLSLPSALFFSTSLPGILESWWHLYQHLRSCESVRRIG